MTAWSLGNVEIPFPTSFRVEPFDIKYADRVASGKLVIDKVASKERYKLEYEAPELSDLANFFTLKALDSFLTFRFDRNGVFESKIVWFEEIVYEGEYVSPESWKNVEIVLEEQ